MHLDDPLFPPLLTGHAVKAPLVPFEEACQRASAGMLDAGDCVWARSTRQAALAIVLEPEVPLATAIQMGPLLQTAVVQAIGALMPPQVAVQIRWPSTLLLNGGIAGTTRIAAPRCVPDDIPDWLVVGFELALARDLKGREPGEDAGHTTVSEEGAADLDRTRVLESVAAHFLTWLDIWSDEGFRPAHEQWIGRIEGREHEAPILHGSVTTTALVLGLDDTMTLMTRAADGTRRGLAYSDCIEWQSAGDRATAKPPV